MAYLQEKEEKLVEFAIILPLVKKVLELDQSIVESRFKLKRPYLNLLDQAFINASTKLRNTKAALMKQHIKVYEAERTSQFIAYDIYCRGYKVHIQYLNERLQLKVESELYDCIIHAIVQRLEEARTSIHSGDDECASK